MSYRDLEEIMAERGVGVDHATLNRWVAKYSPLIAERARRRKATTDRSWRMDETYIRVKGEWTYLYRAVDKFGKTLDFASRTFGSCSQSAATNLRRRSFSPALWRRTACPTRSSSTGAEPTLRRSTPSTEY